MQYNRTSDDDVVRVDFTCRRWQAEKLERLAVRYKNGNKSELLRTMLNHIDEKETHDIFKMIRQAVIKLIVENTPYTDESVENYINSIVAAVKEKLSKYPEFLDTFSAPVKRVAIETAETIASSFLSLQSRLNEKKHYNGGLFYRRDKPNWIE